MYYNFIKNTEINLYYSEIQKSWLIKNKNGVEYNLSSSEDLSSFLQIFYEDPKSFFSEILKTASKEEIDQKVLETLPFKKTIIFCIQNRLSFWLEQSIDWLQVIPLDKELKENLLMIKNDKKISQSLRHKLTKLLNYISKSPI